MVRPQNCPKLPKLLTHPHAEYIFITRLQEESASMICPKCQFNNQPGIVYCGKCGSKLPVEEDITAAATQTMQVPVKQLIRGSLFAGRF